MKTVAEEGISYNVKLEPDTKIVLDTLGGSLVTATSIYAGTKIAASVPSVGGKVAVVVRTMAMTAVANAVIQEVKSEDSFFKINISVEDSSYPKDNPPSPTGSNFTAFSIYEPEDNGLPPYIESIETTDSLYRVLNSMLQLSELSVFFLVLMGINLLFIFV